MTIKASVNKLAFVNKEQQVILNKLGLWEGCRKVIEKPVKNDPLNFQVTTIRTTEVTGGAMGTYKVEALRNCFPMASFQWTYMVRGNNEMWMIRATRCDDYERVLSAELTYDANGTCSDYLSHNDSFMRMFVWLFKDEQAATPFWLGEFSFTAEKTKWKLITKSSCPDCDSGVFCNC